MLTIKPFPTQSTHVSGPLLLLIIALCCYVFNDVGSDYFVYHRELIIDHQYWRLLTGHFFHTNFAHWLLNTLAIVLLWGLHGHYYSLKSYVSLVIFSALFIACALLVFEPSMNEYVGLSGILHALFVWGALKDIESQDKTGYLLLIGVCLKIAHEQYFGASEDVAALINANVAINAHLFGGVAGLLSYLVYFPTIKQAKSN